LTTSTIAAARLHQTSRSCIAQHFNMLKEQCADKADVWNGVLNSGFSNLLSGFDHSKAMDQRDFDARHDELSR
jgi:hypothetical protein